MEASGVGRGLSFDAGFCSLLVTFVEQLGASRFVPLSGSSCGFLPWLLVVRSVPMRISFSIDQEGPYE